MQEFYIRDIKASFFFNLSYNRLLNFFHLFPLAAIQNPQRVVMVGLVLLLHLLLQVEWPGGRLVREYTALIDPPYKIAGKAAPVETPVVTPPAPEPVPAPMPALEPAPMAEAPPVDMMKEEIPPVVDLFTFKVSPTKHFIVWYAPEKGLLRLNLTSKELATIHEPSSWLNKNPFFAFYNIGNILT